jgi:hypothetical protein
MTLPVLDACAVRDGCAEESEIAGLGLFSRGVKIVHRVMRVQVRDGCAGE